LEEKPQPKLNFSTHIKSLYLQSNKNLCSWGADCGWRRLLEAVEEWSLLAASPAARPASPRSPPPRPRPRPRPLHSSGSLPKHFDGNWKKC